MEERCFICERSSDEIRLLDCVCNNQRMKICTICAQAENMPIIRRPTTDQLKEAEKPYSVHERLARMAGFKVEKQTPKLKTSDDFNKERVKKIRESIKPLNLVDNYNWYIQRMRRARNMTRKQLAESIDESEEAIKMMEQGAPPSNAEGLVKKLEQFFMIKLVKPDEGYVDESIVNMLKQKAAKPIQQLRRQAQTKTANIKPSRDIIINRKAIPSLRIGDLKALENAKKAVGSTSNMEDMTAAGLVNDIIAKDESSDAIDDYEWRGKTLEERRKIFEETKNKEKNNKERSEKSDQDSNIEIEDSLLGNDLDIEEKSL